MKTVNEASEIIKVLENIKMCKSWVKHYEKEQEKYTQELYNLVNEEEELISEDGEILATWKYASDGKRFNLARFKEEFPMVYEKYSEVQPGSRRLIIK